MKKSERISRTILIFLVAVALLAIGLQVINEKTNALETTYAIITFAVSLIALTMAVMQGLNNARTTRELTKIAREIRQLMNSVEEDERRELALKREVRRNLKNNQQELELLTKRQK